MIGSLFEKSEKSQNCGAKNFFKADIYLK